MLTESVISQRLVYEAVSKAGGATEVDITDEMVKKVRNSHRLFNTEQEEKKKKQSEGQKKMAEKRKMNASLKKAVEMKKAKVDEMKEAIWTMDKDIFELQEQLKK